MTMRTKDIYLSYAKFKAEPEKPFRGKYPEWPLLDRISNWWSVRILFGAGYFLFYWYFATAWWQFLLLPIHFFMGPVHGAIVNWCGHKYGYSNYDNEDHSRNTLPVDFLLMGELMQNNHHKSPNSINFAKKWYEFDPTFPIILLLDRVRIIKLKR